MIQTVLFDVDGVLLDSLDANAQFFHNLFTKAGYIPPTIEEYKKSMFFLTMVDVIKLVTKLTSEAEIEAIKQIGLDRANLYPYDMVKMATDVKPIIQQLAEQYPLGLVTSRVRSGIYSIPQLAELKEFFKVTVAYEDVKRHKPDPDALLFATTALGISPDAAVYIGDAETDFKAAKAAGMKIIMYGNESVIGADGYISTFTELPPLLQTL